MDKTPLYQEIAESIRQQILYGTLHPGDELPTVREMSERWGCAPGTVQRAYQELAEQGLIAGRAGQGTRVASLGHSRDQQFLRRATLLHETEAFLLNVMAMGYTLAEIEQAVRVSLDRWRVLAQEPLDAPQQVLRFVGSHDPALSLVAARFADLAEGVILQLAFAGSLGGLIALAEQRAELAGSHLWDDATDRYNTPIVQRLLPGRRIALVTLAYRRLGLLVPPGNPAGIEGLEDLIRSDVRFVNRQPGAGTRVWLDAQLRLRGIDPGQIEGYDQQVHTHSDVAQAIAQRRADAGLGIEAAALAYGLDFVFLARERYDLVIPQETFNLPPVQALIGWLASEQAQVEIAALGGYDTRDTGQIEWVG
jgi:molybdate-binding protein/DNA-binding transcriptional regulator YhcF (GntR family)